MEQTGICGTGESFCSITNCSAQTESALKGGTLTGLTDTSIWYYDGGTSYPKLQFEVGNTMPSLSTAVEQESVQEPNVEELTSSLENAIEQQPVAFIGSSVEEKKPNSALKIFGLSASGIFVMLTILSTKNKKRKFVR